MIAEGNLALGKENIREAFSYFNQIGKQDEYYFDSQIGIAKIEMIDGESKLSFSFSYKEKFYSMGIIKI